MADELIVGGYGVVHGRLPRGCSLAARFDRTTKIIYIDSPDLRGFSINVDLRNVVLEETYKPSNMDVLEHGNARLVSKKDGRRLRYDSPDMPEFWVEVHYHNLIEYITVHSKTFKTSNIAAGAAADPVNDVLVHTKKELAEARKELEHVKHVELKDAQEQLKYKDKELKTLKYLFECEAKDLVDAKNELEQLKEDLVDAKNELKDATGACEPNKKKRRINEDEWSGPVGVEYPGF